LASSRGMKLAGGQAAEGKVNQKGRKRRAEERHGRASEWSGLECAGLLWIGRKGTNVWQDPR